MLTRLLDHLIWADVRTADALATLPMPDAELLRLYAHVLGAEAVWLARIAGRSGDVLVWPTLSLEECRQLAATNHAEFVTMQGALDDGDGERVVSYANTRGERFDNTVNEILHHVCLHGMYHRGQVMLGIRQEEGTPISTDFIVFARGA